jgi:hypothetical protein
MLAILGRWLLLAGGCKVRFDYLNMLFLYIITMKPGLLLSL